MTPEYHCFIGGRNGTANAATSACPATRRQNRNRRNQSTVAYMGGTLVTGRSTHERRYRTLLWGPRRGNTHRSAPTGKEKPAGWVPTQPVRNSLLSRHKRATRRRALRFIASELRSNMLGAGWAARLPQTPPVQTAVLNRLAHVLGLEVGRPFEVGQGAGDLENPVIRPRGQGEPRDRRAQQRVGAVRHAAEDADVPRRHVGVGVDARPAREPLPLHC